MKGLTTFTEILNILGEIPRVSGEMFANIPCYANWRIVSMRQATNYRGDRRRIFSRYSRQSIRRAIEISFCGRDSATLVDCVSASSAGNCFEIEAKKRDNGHVHRSRSFTSSCRLATERANGEAPRKITSKATMVKESRTFIRREKNSPKSCPMRANRCFHP